MFKLLNMEPEESITIIQSMIERSKQKISNSSKHFLLWGWAVFLSALGQYFWTKLHYPNGFLIWLSMPLAAVVALIMGINDKKTQTVSTYTQDAIRKLWWSMTLGFILLAYYQLNGHGNSIPIFIMLYGIGILTTGNLLEFKPLIIGGSLCFIISLIGMRMENDLNQLLLLALAVLVSYIIPGYLLRAAYKNERNQ